MVTDSSAGLRHGLGLTVGHVPDAVAPREDRIVRHVAAVEAVLSHELDALQASWNRNAHDIGGPFTVDPPAELRALLDRGGKRVRPMMVYLGWLAADVRGDRPGYGDAVTAAAALEMLHCFALVHDDMMDRSPTRRGDPTVHATAAQRHVRHGGRGDSAHFGDSVAVLVGDLAHSEADRLAADLPAPMRAVWQQMVLELIAGQLWDVSGAAEGRGDVHAARLIARHKTGYYTVARPLQLGAHAAGADARVLSALDSYGRHAGEAFALRDDLLGVYGDPQRTGKPTGEDIRSGKPTVLRAIALQALRGPAARALRATGPVELTDDQVLLVQDAMIDEGVVAAVESMIDERVADALSSLTHARLSVDGIAELTRVVDDLARRGR